MSLLDTLNEARSRAMNNQVPIRQKNKVLYNVMADCMSICAQVLATNAMDELREAVILGTNGVAGSRFVKSSSDVYTIVCRYVLGNREDRSSITKYSQAVREASKLGVKPENLSDWMVANGGMRALYLRVKAANPRKGMKQATLHLNERIEYPREGPFTLVLRYDGKGFFDVVKGPLRCEQ